MRWSALTAAIAFALAVLGPGPPCSCLDALAAVSAGGGSSCCTKERAARAEEAGSLSAGCTHACCQADDELEATPEAPERTTYQAPERTTAPAFLATTAAEAPRARTSERSLMERGPPPGTHARRLAALMTWRC